MHIDKHTYGRSRYTTLYVLLYKSTLYVQEDQQVKEIEQQVQTKRFTYICLNMRGMPLERPTFYINYAIVGHGAMNP